MAGGTKGHVSDAITRIPDRRARHFWDPTGVTMTLYRERLGTPREAWDVYLLYGPKTTWTARSPPSPDFVMHQLRGETGPGPWEGAPYLDADVLADEARALVTQRR